MSGDEENNLDGHTKEYIEFFQAEPGHGGKEGITVNTSNLPLEQKLYYSECTKQELDDLGIKKIDGYAGSNNYLPYKKADGSIFLFEKKADSKGKEAYYLRMYITPIIKSKSIERSENP